MQHNPTYHLNFRTVNYYPFGMTMPGRSYTSENYRFGFNGMEKDFDVAEGDYITHYRMLDTRLGRWFSTDPIFKPYVSPYNSMSNNPILRIDPNGDDDYFNSKGNYLGTDGKSTNNIRVISNDLFYNLMEQALNGTSSKGAVGAMMQDQSVLLKDFAFSEKNSSTLTKIGVYYNNKLSYKSTVKSVAKKGYFIFTGFDSNSKIKQPIIKFPYEKGIINPSLGNFYNLQNALVHENFHEENHYIFDPISGTFATNSERDGTFEGDKNHLDAYNTQLSHETWNKTTEGFQNHIIYNISKRLASLIETGGSQEFNKEYDRVVSKLNEKQTNLLNDYVNGKEYEKVDD